MTDILPILRTFRRHRTAVGILVAEMALTTAILCNALHMIQDRVAVLTRPSHIDEARVAQLVFHGPAQHAQGPKARLDADLRVLQQVPGVERASFTTSPAYGHSMRRTSLNTEPPVNGSTDPSSITAEVLEGGAGYIETMGWRLLEGRDIQAADLPAGEDAKLPEVWINRVLADKLAPGGASALGKTLYDDGPRRVAGVIEHVLGTQPKGMEPEGPVIINPAGSPGGRVTYLIRAQGQDVEPVLAKAKQALAASDPLRSVRDTFSIKSARDTYQHEDRYMVTALALVALAMLTITAFGIVGLASFWVEQRRRMIGTRRALGATAAQIRQYFQMENLLITSLGVWLGIGGAYGINAVLMSQHEVSRLPWFYVPASALVLVVLGQIAVWPPARQASKVPPVQAMRGA